jgi:hypothetical protein
MADLDFHCLQARAERYAAAPTVTLALRINGTSGRRIDAIALRCQIRIEPARRRYSAAEAQRLNDLFGDTQRWAETLRPLQFTTISAMVPGFTGSIDVELPVPLSYDLDIGSARYSAGLDEGGIPLLLLFSGTVFAVEDGRIVVRQVPWSAETQFWLPVEVWREAIDAHFPGSAWIRISRQTLDELMKFKTSQALPTWESAVQALLARAGGKTEWQL